MTRARELGATVCEGTTVTALSAPNAVTPNWTITAPVRTFESRVLVAADGRNSTVARLCNLLPRSAKRACCAANAPALAAGIWRSRRSAVLARRIFRPGAGRRGPTESLSGQHAEQDIGPARLGRGALWNFARAFLAHDHAADARADSCRRADSLFLVGDAARVVEPFTGEGIYYALASGELAAEAIIARHNGRDEAEAAADYCAAACRGFIVGDSGSIGSRAPRSCLRVLPRRFWKWRDSNQRFFAF